VIKPDFACSEQGVRNKIHAVPAAQAEVIAAHEEFERRCKKFRSSFDCALSKSTIRKTTQEKEATYRIASILLSRLRR
jgi:hypothetical protein